MNKQYPLRPHTFRTLDELEKQAQKFAGKCVNQSKQAPKTVCAPAQRLSCGVPDMLKLDGLNVSYSHANQGLQTYARLCNN